jgi:tetratricopeptide (TPR) repeat protein
VTEQPFPPLAAVDPRDPDAVYRACARAVRMGEEDAALPVLQAAAPWHPNDARIWQILGLAHRARDDLAPAIAAFDKAAALAPRDALIVHSHARVYLEGGRPSVELFDRALALAPGDDMIRLGRMAALIALGGLEQVLAELERDLAANPAWLTGQASLARLRWLAGERGDFARGYEAAAAATPRDIEVWRQWGEVLGHAGRYEEMLALVAHARAALGPHPILDGMEVIALAELGDIPAADRLFAAMGRIGHISMAIRHVRHLLRAGRPAEALRVAEPWLSDTEGDFMWPYVAAGWRLTGDPRWQWLEADPRLVGVYDLAGAIPSLPDLADRLRGLHLSLHQPLEQSLRGGTQTDGTLFSRIEPEIVALRAAVLAAVERHIAQLPPPDPTHPTLRARRSGKLRFAGSWSVRLRDAGFHANHIHPAGWLSSAFYVAVPDAATAQEGWLKLGEPQAELGLGLAPFRHVEPKPGRLVLFPSTMWHGTIPFAAGERITVAFDVARPQ